ncbi:guanylate cyclase activator 2B [Phascolarctos cinereus]|uniref:Guanylate cyclase activator 2B n=1 Tax=Phascolarctos cinereus TaxID=38626 RepID=A0A6P5K122_PHACI|nr:guanylate cyclase activator 2B [Phascolarctos cinereus]
MKVLALPVAAAAMLLMLAQNTQSVFIEYEGLRVKLESVKKLDGILGKSSDLSPPMSMEDSLSMCSNLQLPADLQPVCKTPHAANTFEALRNIARDDCEICVNVACTGCY